MTIADWPTAPDRGVRPAGRPVPRRRRDRPHGAQTAVCGRIGVQAFSRGRTCGTIAGVRASPALLGLLLACDLASSPQAGDPDPNNESRPGVDRGLILSKPAIPLAASIGVVDEPPAPQQEEEVKLVEDDGATTLEALDAEVRRRLPEHQLACTRVKRLACRTSGDLDGDGARDTVALVEPVGKRMLGLAILWGHGGVDLLGAGKRGQRWIEQKDETTAREPIPIDLSWLARWSVWSADGPPDARRGFIDPRTRRFKAPAVRGDGILLDGGDSATIAYHDGKSWRLQYLGF